MKRLILIFLCALCAASLLASCGAGSQTETETDGHIIAVAVYDPADPEMSLFIHYYQDYIAESFPVEFLISGALSSSEDEIDFLADAKQAGAEAVISFYGEDLTAIVEACSELELYYVKGSASLSDEEYEAVKDNPWFLGVIGPSEEAELQAGEDMAASLAAEGGSTFLLLTGGAGGETNFMQYTRVVGMLTALAETLDLTYTEEIEVLAAAETLTVAETDRDDVTIVLSPGYPQTEAGLATLADALALDNYDAVLSAVGLGDAAELLQTASSGEMLVGVVDCFSEDNLTLVESGTLHYVAGKYASMVAPAFVAVFNALEGDVDLVNPDGVAFRLYQSYWVASDRAEYEELYGYTQSIFENAYSSVDLMSVIRAYNEDADYESFCLLTESSDIDSVRARLEG